MSNGVSQMRDCPFQFQRKKNFRFPLTNMVIVCEGSTENIYFNNFKRRNSGLIIYTVCDEHTDPSGIVDDAKNYCRRNPVDLSGGDVVWCVFDVDTSTDAELTMAVSKAEKNGYKVAISNPAIELWFLLHYSDHHGHIERHEAFDKVKGFNPQYEKTYNVYPDIQKDQVIAFQRAKRLRSFHDAKGVPIHSRQSNPCSQIFELLEDMERIIDQNRDRIGLRMI